MGRGKRKSKRKSECISQLCSVCENSYDISMSTTFPCSAHPASAPHTICDTCLYTHIFNVLSQDITSSVICPMQRCDAMIPKDIIQLILVKSNPTLSKEYELKGGWHGTSQQWIRRFAALCPYCSVPIEKNGGCNRVVCQRCRQPFDWQRAKDSILYRMRARYAATTTTKMNFFWRFLFTILILLLLTWCLIYREKTMLIVDHSLTYLTYLSVLFPFVYLMAYCDCTLLIYVLGFIVCLLIKRMYMSIPMTMNLTITSEFA